MSSDPGRQTVASVAAQHSQLEGRVTGLERDMQNMSRAVEALTATVKDGFERSMTYMESQDRKQSDRVSEIHARLDRELERALTKGTTNWGVVIGVVSIAWLMVVAVVAWGSNQASAVAINSVRLDSVDKRVLDLDEMLQREMRLISATRQAEIEALDQRLQHEMRMMNEIAHGEHKALQVQLNTNAVEIDKLRNTDASLIKDKIEHSYNSGYQTALVDGIRVQQDRRWPQFLENAESRGKLQQMVDQLRESYNSLKSSNCSPETHTLFEQRIQSLENLILQNAVGE